MLLASARRVFVPLYLQEVAPGHWVDDHGWWIVNVIYQLPGIEPATFVIAGAQWLWRPAPTPVFNYGSHDRFMDEMEAPGLSSEENFNLAARELARRGAFQVGWLRAKFPNLESSLYWWKIEGDRFAYHLAVGYGLTDHAETARNYFRAARVRGPDDDRQPTQNELIDELTELVGDGQAFRERIIALVQSERASLKLERRTDLDLPR